MTEEAKELSEEVPAYLRPVSHYLEKVIRLIEEQRAEELDDE